MNASAADLLEAGLRRAAAQVGEGRYATAAEIILGTWRDSDHSDESALRCVLPLIAYRCRAAAGVICREVLEGGSRDAELLRLASQLALEQGDFDGARRHALEAVARAPGDGGLLLMLATTRRYAEAGDEDVRRLEAFWRDDTLPREERELAGFALGKCYDDIGNRQAAATVWRQANAWSAEIAQWNDTQWQRFVDFTVNLRPPRLQQPVVEGIVPVFIVGLPRTGTSLVADLLGRFPGVRNRGEMNWIWFVWDRLMATRSLTDPAALAEAARLYLRHLRRDDAPAQWYIDKNPLNIRSLPLIDALFPNARIILCGRGLRDTALSIWSQSFAARENDYAYRFETIATFAEGCQRITAQMRPRLRVPVFALSYEALAEDPETVMRAVAGFIGLPGGFDPLASRSTQAIATASVWQVRQPVYRSSICRWQAYAPFVPELTTLFSENVFSS